MVFVVLHFGSHPYASGIIVQTLNRAIDGTFSFVQHRVVWRCGTKGHSGGGIKKGSDELLREGALFPAGPPSSISSAHPGFLLMGKISNTTLYRTVQGV